MYEKGMKRKKKLRSIEKLQETRETKCRNQCIR